MKRLFNVYRALAFAVGVLLIIVFITWGLEGLLTKGTSLQRAGDRALSVVGPLHGFLYLAYAATTFVLAARARWTLTFTVLAMAGGFVPGLVFWAEHQVAGRMHEEHPELFGARSA